MSVYDPCNWATASSGEYMLQCMLSVLVPAQPQPPRAHEKLSAASVKET